MTGSGILGVEVHKLQSRPHAAQWCRFGLPGGGSRKAGRGASEPRSPIRPGPPISHPPVFSAPPKVSRDPREVPAHPASPEHQHRWAPEDRLCHHRHQGGGQALRPRGLAEGGHRPDQAGWRADGGRGREGDHHHAEPPPVQDPRLVPEQAEGRQGRQVQPGLGQRSGQQTARGFGAAEEDPGPPGPAPLLGPPCPRPAHQDHRPERQDRRRLQEEVKPPPCE